MSGEIPTPAHDSLLALLRSITAALDEEPNASRVSAGEIRAALDQVEAATPGGVPLHTQLDAVRKWLGALEQPGDHDRFGGADHLRRHVVRQVRVAMAALEEYQPEGQRRPKPEP
jgi:hypothetical protein